MKTKAELINFIREQINWGNSVPMVIRGGGADWLNDADIVNAIAADEDYIDVVPSDAEDIEMFRGWLDNVEDYQFYTLSHNSGYNQENSDYIFATWED